MSNPDDPKIGDGGGFSYQPIFDDDDLAADEAPASGVANSPSAAGPDMYTDVPAAPLLQMAGTGGAQGKGGASAINQPQTDPLLRRLAEFHNVPLADIKTLARLYVYIFDKTAPVLVAEGRIPTLRDLFRLIDLTLVLAVKHDFLNLFEAIKLVLLNQFTKPEVREQIFRAVEEVREKVSGIEQGETPKEKLKRKLRYGVEDGLLASTEDMLRKVAEDVGLPLRAYLPFLRGHPRSDDGSASYQFMLNLWRNMSDDSRERYLFPMKSFSREYRRLLRGDAGAEEACFKLITTRTTTDEVRKKIVAYFVNKDREDFLLRVIEVAVTVKSVPEKVASLYVLHELGENQEVLPRLKKLLVDDADFFDNRSECLAYALLAELDPDFKRRLEEYSWTDIQEAIGELMAEQVAASDTQKIAATQRIVFSLVQADAFKPAAGLDAHGNPIPADVQDVLTGLVPKEEALFLVGPTLQALQILAAAIARKHPVYLEGETGTGKNAMLRYLANLAGVPLFRLNFGQETDNEQLYGHYEIQKVDGKRRVVLTDGKMIQAIKYGGWVLWDEANLARPGFLVAQNDVVQQLSTGWVWVRQGGELKKIKVHDNFRLFATGNPEGYADRQSIEKSFGDRWVRVKIREFGKKDTQAILAKLHPDLAERTIADIVDLLFALRQVLGRRGAITLRTAKRVAERVSELDAGSTHSDIASFGNSPQPPLKLRGGERGSYVIRAIEAEVLDGLHARDKAEAIAILNEKLAEVFPLPRGEGVGGGWTPSDSQLDNTLTGVAWGVVDLLGDHDLRQKFDAMVATYCAQAANSPQPPLKFQIIPVPTTLHYATKVLDSLIRGDFLLLEGPPAISKSAIPRWIAELTGREIIEVTGSHDTTVADLVGMPTLDADGNLVFEDGYFTEAIKRDCILLINEANLIKASVMERLNSLFDDDRDIFIIENGIKKPLKLGPNFRLILTQNPEDMRGGRMRLSPALENKLRKIVFDRNFHPLELQAMITVLAPSLKDYAATMVDAFTKQNISLTLRDLKRWISLTEALAATTLYDLPHALKAAAQLVFFSRFAEMADQPFVETIAPYTQALLAKDATPLQAQHVRNLVATLTPILPLPPSPQGRENKMATTLPSPSRGEGQGEGVNAEKLSFIEPTMQALVGLVAGIHANVPVYLEGETGTGKNAMLRYLAYEAGVALVRLNFGLETDNEQLFGGYEIRRVEGRRRVVLTDGKMIEALEHGAWVVWDEVNLARSGFLVSLNDFVQQLESGWVWVRHGGKLRRLQVHKNFRLFATGNPEGYADRQSIEKSFGDRWLKLHVQEFDAAHLQALLADSYPALDSQTVFHIVDMLMALKLVIGRRGVITVRTAKRVAARVSEWQETGSRANEAGDQMRAIVQAIEAEVLDGLNAREKAEAIAELNKKLAGVESMLTDSLVDDILAKVAKGELALLGDHELHAKFDAMIATYRAVISEDPNYVIPAPAYSLPGQAPAGIQSPAIIPVPTTLHYAIKVLDSLIREDFVLLEGPPAISKSAIPQWIGALTGQKVLEVTGTKDMDVSDLLGMPTLDENGDLKFQDGFFLEAIKHGYLLVINEANLIRAGVLERLNSVFDEDRMIYVLENGVKQPITIHKNFRLVLTQNPADMRGGRAQLSPALENKLRKIVFNRNFHPLELRVLVQELYPELAIVSEEIIHAYTKAQDALTKEGEPVTLRNLLQWLEMSTLLGAESTLTPDQALILGGEIVFKARNVATREKIAMLFYRLEEQVGGKLREQARSRTQEAGNRMQEARGKMQETGGEVPLAHPVAGTDEQLSKMLLEILMETEVKSLADVYERFMRLQGFADKRDWLLILLPHLTEAQAMGLLQAMDVTDEFTRLGYLVEVSHPTEWMIERVFGYLEGLTGMQIRLLISLVNGAKIFRIPAVLTRLKALAILEPRNFAYDPGSAGLLVGVFYDLDRTFLVDLMSKTVLHDPDAWEKLMFRLEQFPDTKLISAFLTAVQQYPSKHGNYRRLFFILASIPEAGVPIANFLNQIHERSDFLDNFKPIRGALLALAEIGSRDFLDTIKKYSGVTGCTEEVFVALAALGEKSFEDMQAWWAVPHSISTRSQTHYVLVAKARYRHFGDETAWDFLRKILLAPPPDATVSAPDHEDWLRRIVTLDPEAPMSLGDNNILSVLEFLVNSGHVQTFQVVREFLAKIQGFSTHSFHALDNADKARIVDILSKLDQENFISILELIIASKITSFIASKITSLAGMRMRALDYLSHLGVAHMVPKIFDCLYDAQENSQIRFKALYTLWELDAENMIANADEIYSKLPSDFDRETLLDLMIHSDDPRAMAFVDRIWRQVVGENSRLTHAMGREFQQRDPEWGSEMAAIFKKVAAVLPAVLRRSQAELQGENATRVSHLLRELGYQEEDPVPDQLAVLRRQIADVLLEDEGGNVRMVYEHLVARRGWHNLGVWFYAILPHIKQEEALALMQSLKVSRRNFYIHLLTLPHTPAWVVDFILSNRVELNNCVITMATGGTRVFPEAIRKDPRYAQLLCELLTDDRVDDTTVAAFLMFLLGDAPAAAYDYLRNLYAKNYDGAQSDREKKITESSLRLLSWLPHNLALELLQIFYRCNRSHKNIPCEQSFMIELGRLSLDLKKDLLFEIIAGEVTSVPKLLESGTASDAQYTLAEWAVMELTPPPHPLPQGEGEEKEEGYAALLTRVKEFSGHPSIRSWVLDLALARLGDGEALASLQSKFTAYFSQFKLSRVPITELRVGVIPDLSAYEAVQMAETLAKNNHLPAWEFLEELLRDPLQVHPKQSKIKTVGHIHTAVLEALSRLGGERADGPITWFFETCDPNFVTSREDEVYLTLADEFSIDNIPLSLQPHHEIPLLVRAIDNQKLQHTDDKKPRALLRLKKLDPDLAQQKARQVVENKLESARIRVGAYKLLSAAAQKELIHLVYEEVRKDDAWVTWIEVLVAVEGQAALPTLRALWEKLDEAHTRDAMLLARLLMQLDPTFAGAEAKLSRHYGSLLAEELQKLHGMAEGERTARTAALLEELEEWGGERAGSKMPEARGKKQEAGDRKQEAGDRRHEAGGEDQFAALRRQIVAELAESESGNVRAVYEHLLARRGWFNIKQWFGTVAPHLTREECEELCAKLAIPHGNYLEILLTLPHLPQWVVDYLLSDVVILQRCIDLKTSGKGGGGNFIPAAIRQDARCGRLLEELLSLDDMRWGATGMYLYYFLQDFPDRAYDFLHAMYSKKAAGGSENERGIVKLSLGVLDRLSPERALTLLQSYYHNRGPSESLLSVPQPMERFRRQLGLIPQSLKRDFLVEIVGGYEGHWDPGKFSDGYTLAEWAVMELAASSDAGLLESMRLWEGHLRIRPPILHLAMAQLGDATGMQLTQAHFDSKPELPWKTVSLMVETLARHGYEPAWEFLDLEMALAPHAKYATVLGILSRLGGARGDALLAAFMKRERIDLDFNQEGSLVFSLVFDRDIKGIPLQLQPQHEIPLLVALIENPTHRSKLAIIPSALARLVLLDANLCEKKAREVFEFGNLLAADRSKVFKYLSEDAKKELIHIVYAELAANRNVASWIDVLVTEEGVKAIPTLLALWEKVDESKPTVAWKLAGHLARLDPEWSKAEAEMSRHYSRLIAEELKKSHGEVAGERAERTTELLGELEGWEGEQQAGEEAAAVIARNVSDEAISLAVSAREKIARMLVEQDFMSLSEIYAAVAEAFGVEVDVALEQTILELINLPYTDLIAMAGERVNARLQGLRGHNLQDAYGKPLSYEKIQWLMSLVPPPEKLSMIGPTTQALEWLFGAIKSNFPIYLEGETGIGKNAILRFLAHKTATPLMRINFGYETDNEQLYGGYAIERVDGKRRVVLTDGKMIQALQYGAWVVWDEVNLARAGFLVAQNDIVQQIRSGSVWVRRGGRVEQIPVHAHFRLFATGNPQGYAGRQAIEKSFGNRWIKLILSPFKKEEIRLIMAESYPRIPEQTLNFVVNTLHELRRAIGGNFEISIRTYKRVSSRVEEALQMIGVHDLWDRGAGGLPVLTAKGMGLFLQAIEAEVLDGLDAQTYQVALNTLRVALPRGERDVHDFVSEKFLDDIFALVDRGEASLLGDHVLRAKFDVLLGQYGAQIYNSPQPPLELRGGERGSYAVSQIVPVPTTLHYATKVLDAFLHKQFIILEGPPSVSKTEIPKWLGNLVGQEVIEVTGTKEKSVADLLGMPTLDEDGNIVFKEGYLLKALQTGAILILNEANLLQAAVLERLNSLFDDDREILVVEGNHKVPVKIHENFRLVLTQNPADMRGGRNQFSPALVNKLRRIYFRRAFTTLELEAIAEARIRGIFGDTYGGPGGISSPSPHSSPTRGEGAHASASEPQPPLEPRGGSRGSYVVVSSNQPLFQTVFGPQKKDGVPGQDEPPRISEKEIAEIERKMCLEAQEFMREHGHHLRAMSALAALRHVEIKVDQSGAVDIAAMDLDKGIMYINPAAAKNLTPHQLLAVALHEGGHGAITRLDRDQFFFKDELRHFLANCIEDPRVNEYILSRLPGARADFISLYGDHFPDPQLIADADRLAKIRPLGGLPHEQFALAFIDLWANGHLTDRVVHPQIRADLANLETVARQIWAAFPTEDPPRRRTVVAKQEYAYDLIKENIYPLYLKYVEESKKMIMDALQQMKDAGKMPSHIPAAGGTGRGFPIDWNDLDESARRILEGRAEEQAGWFEPSETSGNRARQVGEAKRRGEGERQKGKAGEGRYKQEDFGDFGQKTLADILQDRARDQAARQEFYDGHPWRKYFDPVRNVAEEVAEALRQLLHLNDDFIWDDFFHTSGPKLSIKRTIQMILRDEFGILTAEDLKIFLRKNFPTRRSHRFVLVLDESGSMKGGAQDSAMQAMAMFEYVMQELAMQYAVVGFDHVADVHKDFSEDFADEKAKDNHMYIMETSGGGGTNDYEGIKLAHEMLGEGRQLVIGLGIGAGTEAVAEVFDHYYQSDSFAGLPTQLTQILVKYLLSPDAPEDIILVVTDGAGVEETKDLVARIEGREKKTAPTEKTASFVRPRSGIVQNSPVIHPETGVIQAEDNLVTGGNLLVGKSQPPLSVRGGERGSYDAVDVAAAPVADDNPVSDSTTINAPFLEPHVSILGSQSGVFRSTARVMKAFVR